MPHAPFDSDQIESTGLHHAFLGHYNRPRDDQAFTFPGNPDPLTLGECGCQGVVVASIQGNGTVERERASVGDTQVHDLGIDVTGSVSQQDVRDRVHEVLEGLSGFARVHPLSGEISAHIDFRTRDLSTIDSSLDPVIVEVGMRHIGYPFESIREKQTVRD